MKRGIDAALGLLALDLTLIVSSGGFSVLGAVSPGGVGFRVATSLALLVLRYRLVGRASFAAVRGRCWDLFYSVSSG